MLFISIFAVRFLILKKVYDEKILFLSAVAVIFAACQSKTEYTINGEVTDSSFEGQHNSC